MNNTEKLVLQQHFVTPSGASSTVTVRPLPGLRWYAGPAGRRLCLAHDHFPRLCLLGGAKYRGITVVIMGASCAKATIMVAGCAKSGHQVGSVMHLVMVTTQASRVAA